MGRGHVGGAASLAGIGFTVSLFVTDLAFDDQVLRDQAKIGVLVASVIAAVVGLAILARRPQPEDEHAGEAPRLEPPVDAAFDRTRGAVDAPQTVLVFGDYECPHTRGLVDVLRELEDEAGDGVLYAWRQLPNEGAHPGTMLASEAALGAAAQGAFWPFHRRLLQHPIGDDLGAADLLDIAREVGLDVDRLADDLRHHVRRPAVQAEVDSAARSGVAGTPTLFIDGERYDGPHEPAALLEALRAAR